MTDQTRAATTKPRQRLSTAQMMHLMRLEIDRALRYSHAISCMVIGLDGYEEELRDHRRTIMPDVFHQLKEVTFGNDVRGLGIWTRRYLLAVFPHVTPEKIADLAGQMIERGERVPRPSDDAPPITLSVGISHNLHPGPISFETLVEEAEVGMGLAFSAGGNRFVQARDVETEIDRLREEVEGQIQDIQRHQEVLFGQDNDLDDGWAKEMIAEAIHLFEREPEQSEGVLRLHKEVIALIRSSVQKWRDSNTVAQMLQSQRQVEQLERRVRKLTDNLGVTENELKKVAKAKNIDLGVSSLYRTVQGLSDDDEQADLKREMLTNIFEANLVLQGKVAAKTEGEG